eukprot:scaffold101425_cov23-Tisochrysis_lutea.AAC.1
MGEIPEGGLRNKGLGGPGPVSLATRHSPLATRHLRSLRSAQTLRPQSTTTRGACPGDSWRASKRCEGATLRLILIVGRERQRARQWEWGNGGKGTYNL